MDHAQVREVLELAAVEPGGLDRLAAGDTAESAAVAGHLAGCPPCMEEARRMAAIGPVLRDAVASIPPDELRASTLALVHAVGRERPVVPSSSGLTEAPLAAQHHAGRRRPRWPTLAAAAVIVAVVAGGSLLAIRSVGQFQGQASNLADLNQATLEVTAQLDAVRVSLVGVADPSAEPGTLLFSPKNEELVVSAPSLTEPDRGQKFACWMIRPDGSRVRLGWMEFGGGLAYWSGWSKELAQAGPGTVFGVSLVDSDGKPAAPGDVLTGTAGRS
jgi:hypothetical protein